MAWRFVVFRIHGGRNLLALRFLFEEGQLLSHAFSFEWREKPLWAESFCMSAPADDGLLSLNWREVVQLWEYAWEDVTQSFLCCKGAIKESTADEMKLVHYEEPSQKGETQKEVWNMERGRQHT